MYRPFSRALPRTAGNPSLCVQARRIVTTSPIGSNLMAKIKRRPTRELETIRSEIRAGALRLETVAGELGLPELVAELERDHLPTDPAALEAIGTGDVCPPLAFEVAGDVAAAGEALTAARDALERAAALTPAAVRAAWEARTAAVEAIDTDRLRELIADSAPAARELGGRILEHVDQARALLRELEDHLAQAVRLEVDLVRAITTAGGADETDPAA